MSARVGFSLLLISCCTAMAGETTSIQIDGVAAYANGHTITFSDVIGASRELLQKVRERQDGEDVNSLYLKTLDDLINRKLIVDAYEDQKEIKIPDEMVTERVETVVREMFKDDRIAFLRALSQDGQSEAEWRTQIREQMVVGAMRNLRVDSQVRVSPLTVRERYMQAPERYAKPAAVKFSMIVIAKGEDEASQATQRQKLEKAQAALASGTVFEEVARQFSEESLASEGGVRDWMPPDMMRSELAELVMKADLGAVSDVIEMGSNCILLKVEGRRDAAPSSFDEAYTGIERELRQEEGQRIYEQWIARLRKDSFVRILRETL